MQTLNENIHEQPEVERENDNKKGKFHIVLDLNSKNTETFLSEWSVMLFMTAFCLN